MGGERQQNEGLAYGQAVWISRKSRPRRSTARPAAHSATGEARPTRTGLDLPLIAVRDRPTYH